jgi:hypothetical protein
MDRIIATKFSRVINVSSAGHSSVKEAVKFESALVGRHNTTYLGYISSKYGNVLHAEEL